MSSSRATNGGGGGSNNKRHRPDAAADDDRNAMDRHRNNGGAAASSSSSSSSSGRRARVRGSSGSDVVEDWPVLVYRYTARHGRWELYHHPLPPPSSGDGDGARDPASSSSSSSSHQRRQDGGKDDPRHELVRAAPRRGCVEVHALRLRVRLFDGGDGEDESSVDALVVRRGDTILLGPRARQNDNRGAIVLKFRSTGDCLSFSDRLVALNGGGDVHSSAVHRSCDRPDNKRRRIAEEEKGRSRNAYEGETMTAKSSSTTSSVDTGGKNKENDNVNLAKGAAAKSEEAMSYVVRLLHDDGFLGFVDEIESSLKSNPSCQGIWEALGRGSRAIRSNL